MDADFSDLVAKLFGPQVSNIALQMLYLQKPSSASIKVVGPSPTRVLADATKCGSVKGRSS